MGWKKKKKSFPRSICPRVPRRPPSVKQAVPVDKNLKPIIGVRTCEESGHRYGDTNRKIPGRAPFDAPRSPMLAVMRSVSFADHTTGVSGTSVRSRRARWRSGSTRWSVGYTETGILGKIHLETITTTLLLYYIIQDTLTYSSFRFGSSRLCLFQYAPF